MNILVDPFFIGFFQVIISFIIISGLAFSGRYINNFLFKNYQSILLDIIIGLIIFSQILKIITYLGFFNKLYIVLSFFFLLVGIFNLKNIIPHFHYKNYLVRGSKFNIIIILSLLSFLLISVAPPSMADALDYHYGIPLYLLKYYQIPNINFWLYANVGGNGDIFNAVALYLKTDNFVSVLQFVCLVLFLIFLKKEIHNNNKFIFASIFVISSPTLLQLLSGPKFMILPQIMTALALYFCIRNKKIEVIDFIFILILVMGASQFKSSFLISGFLIGLYALIKTLKVNFLQVLFYSFLLSLFFFIPTAVWNFFQISDFNLVNIFSIMPEQMMINMKIFKENDFIYPINIFIPSSLGKVSTILGFQIFFLLFFLKKSSKYNLVLIFIFFTIILHYFLGMNVARMYYEFILWGAIGLIFSQNDNKKYYFYSKIILPQTIIVICFSLYFSFITIPTLFSNKARDNFMNKNTFYYEGVKWVNKNLPNNAKIISTIRSVALLKNDFAPTDILDFNLNEYETLKYLKLLKQKEFNYILIADDNLNHPFQNCIGEQYRKSQDFQRSTRNPLNRRTKYNLSINHFNFEMLPGCFKR
jgi:hypothetical protein